MDELGRKDDVPSFLSFEDITDDPYKRDEYVPDDESDGDSDYNTEDYEPEDDLSDSDTAEITGVDDSENNTHDENDETNQETDEDALFDTDETTTTQESDEENENETNDESIEDQDQDQDQNENNRETWNNQETDEDALFDTDETTTTQESDEENENEIDDETIEDQDQDQDQDENNRETRNNQKRPDADRERNRTVVQDVEEADPRITGVLQGGEQEQEEIPLANFDTRYPEEEVTFDQDEESNEIEEIQDQTNKTRSGRETKPPQKYVPDFKGNKYAFATILATLLDTEARKKNYIVGKDYPYNRAKRLMGREKVEKSAYVEFEQIHKRGTLSPIHPKIMTREESEKVLRSIVLTKMKASGECKTRTVADGSQQR